MTTTNNPQNVQRVLYFGLAGIVALGLWAVWTFWPSSGSVNPTILQSQQSDVDGETSTEAEEVEVEGSELEDLQKLKKGFEKDAEAFVEALEVEGDVLTHPISGHQVERAIVERGLFDVNTQLAGIQRAIEMASEAE